MFQATHVIIYSRSAEADRAFLRDALRLPYVDAGDNWLTFKLPPAELAIHPTEGQPMHTLYFMCADIEATLDSLVAAGAVISSPISDQRWGRVAEIALPSGTTLPIYEPRHPVAYDLG
jgi:catechol 2,3-dioxygenase-like lactoylglutathione lyase family enzyme